MPHPSNQDLFRFPMVTRFVTHRHHRDEVRAGTSFPGASPPRRPERAPARTGGAAPMPSGGAAPWRWLRSLALLPLLSAVVADASLADHSRAAEFLAPHRARPGAPIGVARLPDREAASASRGISYKLRRAWRRMLDHAALSLCVLTVARSCWPRRRRTLVSSHAVGSRCMRARRAGHVVAALVLLTAETVAAKVRPCQMQRGPRPRPRDATSDRSLSALSVSSLRARADVPRVLCREDVGGGARRLPWAWL